MTTLYRLPGGRTTTDANKYGDAWNELALEIESFFPGYVVYGMDPDLAFRPLDPKRHDTFRLPLGACLALKNRVT